MAVFSQIAIPLPIGVPVTLQAFAVVIIAIVLEQKLATLALFIFTLVGGIGVPVFANFNAGIRVIIGPTGGYIIGFIMMAFIIGAASKSNNKWEIFISVYAGLVVDYTIGVAQLAIVAKLSLAQALAGGMYPFVIKDVIAVGLGAIVALKIKRIVRKELIKSATS
jgi:biotin transport system substrate-specific component